MSRFTLAFSILVCLLLVGPALAQIEQIEMEAPATASPPLGGPTSITQNLDPNIIDLGITCSTPDNSFLRLYDLDGEFGLSGSVCAQSVDYGALSPGSMNVTANVYCLNDGDAFLVGNLIQVGTNTFQQPGGPEPSFYNIPVGGCCDAATQSMAVQTVNVFSQGFNQAGQTAPSYLLCPDDGFPEIIDLTVLGWPDAAALVQVVNLAAPAAPILSPWSLALLGAGLLAVLALAFTLTRRYSTA